MMQCAKNLYYGRIIDKILNQHPSIQVVSLNVGYRMRNERH